MAKTLSTTSRAAIILGQGSDGGDVHQFQRRVGGGFQKEHLRVRSDGVFPGAQIASIHQRGLDAVLGAELFHHPAAGAEQSTRRHDMIARLQLAHQRRRHRAHAGSRGERRVRPFQRAHALLEHGDRGVLVARVDITVLVALEAGFGGLGAVVDETLREVERLGRFPVGRAVGAAMDEFGGRLPAIGHKVVPNKKPARIAAEPVAGTGKSHSLSLPLAAL